MDQIVTFSFCAVSTMCKKEAEVSLLAPVMNMKCRKVLKGHRGRMLHFDWSADRSHVITAGQVREHTPSEINVRVACASRMAML